MEDDTDSRVGYNLAAIILVASILDIGIIALIWFLFAWNGGL